MLLFNKRVAAGTIWFLPFIQDWRESQLYITSLLSHLLEQQGLCKMNTDQTPFCVLCLQFNRAHSHKSQSLTTFWLTFPPFLLRTFWEITWLGSYLEDSGSLHNHMERAICRHVLPLSLLVNRGSPSLVFHQKKIPKGWSQHLLAWERGNQEMRYHRNSCVYRE